MYRQISAACAIALAVAAPAAAQDTAGESPGAPKAAVGDFVDRNGAKAGTASLLETPHGVVVAVAVRGLQPGEHGIHIHAVGRCDPANGFKSAGDHWAHQGEAHGYSSPEGPHAGDMPNQFASNDGTLEAHIFQAGATLSPGDHSMMDADGVSIVVHEKADDYVSQPSGNSGDRVACAVIKLD
jgi:Cu-Zn family superoxide dismutase